MLKYHSSSWRAGLNKNIPSEDIYKKISEWLEIYHSTDNEVKKSRMKANIVANMVPVVKKLARTIGRRSYDPLEDLTQAGFIGLLKAIDTYSPEKGAIFRIYAGYFIIGEMRHYVRDKMKMIRVPRYIHELCIRINNFTASLTPEEVNNLTSEHVASILNIPQKTVDFAILAERRSKTISLDNTIFNDCNNATLEKFVAGPTEIKVPNLDNIKEIYNDIIKLLPPEEQIIIDMYYKQDMNQREIAEFLNISKMSVYRRIKNAFGLIIDYIDSNIEKKQKIMEYLEIGENNDK